MACSNYWTGFRLWKSVNGGGSFSLINSSVPSSLSASDKPALVVNNFPGLPNTADLYAAGRFDLPGGTRGIAVTHSSAISGGAAWDGTTIMSPNSQGADVTIGKDGTVYVFYVDLSTVPSRLKYKALQHN